MMFASENKASGAVNTSGSEVRAPDKKALIWRWVLVSQSRSEKKTKKTKQNKEQDVNVNAAWESLVGIWHNKYNKKSSSQVH